MSERMRVDTSRGVLLAQGQVVPARKPAIQSSMVRDRFERQSPVTHAPLDQWRSAIAALAQLPAVPLRVPEKRAWVASARQVLESAQRAQMAMQLAAFPANPDLMAESEAAFTAVAKTELRLRRIEEQAGLRKPEAPLDPKRPVFERTRSLQGLTTNPVGAALSTVVLPAVGLLDTVEALSRNRAAQDFPREMERYRVRLAEYERARLEYPVDGTP